MRKFTDSDWKRLNEVHSEQQALRARVDALEVAIAALAGHVDAVVEQASPARNFAAQPADGFAVVRDERVKP